MLILIVHVQCDYLCFVNIITVCYTDTVMTLHNLV